MSCHELAPGVHVCRPSFDGYTFVVWMKGMRKAYHRSRTFRDSASARKALLRYMAVATECNRGTVWGNPSRESWYEPTPIVDVRVS